MKNIKKMALYATIIVATTYHYQVYSKPAFVAVVKAADELLTNHTSALLDASAKVGSEGLSAIANGIQNGIQNGALNIDPTLVNQAAGTLGDKLKEASPTFGLKAAEKLAPVLGAGVVIYGTFKVVSTATDAYNHFNPDKEKQARIDEATEKVEYYKAKRGLRSCFMSNPKTPRNNEELPIACQNFSDTYRTIAGKAAFDEMVTSFKDTYAYKGY